MHCAQQERYFKDTIVKSHCAVSCDGDLLLIATNQMSIYKFKVIRKVKDDF